MKTTTMVKRKYIGAVVVALFATTAVMFVLNGLINPSSMEVFLSSILNK